MVTQTISYTAGHLRDSVVIGLLAVIFTCGSTNYMEPGESQGEFGPRDSAKTAEHMADSIHRYLLSQSARPIRIEVKRLSNRSTAHIDTRMILDTIQENLIRRGITFVDAVPGKTTVPPSENLLYLSGALREDFIPHPEYRIAHYTTSMTLVNSISSNVEWMDSLKIEKKARITRINF
jgi:hypothetical protein